MAYDQPASAALQGSDLAIDEYVGGIKSAHALEKQATQLINRQLERIESYPEVAALIREHGAETEAQIERLERVLSEFGTGPSALKDLATQVTGNLAAIGHTTMSDEVMKNHFANVAFEAFEQATYRSLIAMARATGHEAHVALWQQSLAEEEKTFRTLMDMTDALTTKYLGLRVEGGQAKR